jgi:hypothetical protein
MLKLCVPLACLVALAACQPNQPTTADKPAPPPPPTVAAPPAPAAAQCYGYTAQDTVYLALTSTAPTASGTLIYHYAGKDRNRGTISGAFSGDTLRADYTFQSEGVTSVRQVVFLKRANGLLEGYGPVTERAGKTVFRQPHQLKYDTRITLAPVACK